ncbi:MAG TPA: orotidine-5'-phosphate decarboxylase [Candidatus Margulisiibacteriota bacterium]|nr:orotidine-5'-phosphate decarboxylase [Candidatus Margulisiibacteriota bacterium]
MARAEPHHFADCLIGRVRALGHPLCVGIDPYLECIPPLFRRGDMARCAPATADAVQEFCCRIVDLVADRVAVIKPQMALFEALGWRGFRVLERVVQHARALGLLVVLDAKRGDIAATAAGYAAACLGADAPLAVDAITVNPYLGCDTVAPFVATAQTTARGVIVLVRNSNPGSTTYQYLQSPAGRLSEVVARSLAAIVAAVQRTTDELGAAVNG